MSTTCSLSESQLKTVNDYDLRLLVEQSVELRHVETVALAGAAIATTILTKIPGSTLNEALQSLLYFSLLLVIIGAVCERRARVAKQILDELYPRFIQRNLFEPKELVFLSGYKLDSKTMEKTPVPLFMFFFGAGFSFLVLAFRTLSSLHR